MEQAATPEIELTEAEYEELVTGRRRAAVALVAIGEERAALLLAAMGPHDAQQLAEEVLQLGPVTAEEITEALTELGERLNTVHAAAAPGEEFTRGMLVKAFGANAGNRMMEEITRPEEFTWLSEADPDVASRVLAAEPPGTIALALAHIEPKAAARLLTKLPEEVRAEVALRVATMDAVDAETVTLVDSALRERVGTTLRAKVQRVSGSDLLAGMLSAAPRSAEDALVSHLQVVNPEVARKVRSALFKFDDLVRLTPRHLQKVLSEIEVGDLAIAVSAAKPETMAGIAANLSERARANLEEEVSFLPALRANDVRAAQEKIMGKVRELESLREIEIPRAGDDEEGL